MIDIDSLKKEADRIMEIPGNQKGETMKSILKYVREFSGEQGVEKIQKGLIDVGYPFDFDEVHILREYPDSRNALLLLLCKELLNYTDEDIFKMGYEMSKGSFVDQLFMKTFISVEKAVKNAPLYWKKHLSVGEVEVCELNKEKKYFILHLKDYAFHPLVCLSISGYFLGLIHYLESSATIQETKCIHKGDPYHEFKISW